MRPLIFEFKENPIDNEILDYSLIEYDKELNLSINKLTRQPAIDTLNLETHTFTKAQCEGSDSDIDLIGKLMDTETRTYTKSEMSDRDYDRMALQNLLDTSTSTRASEITDKDSYYDTNHHTQN